MQAGMPTASLGGGGGGGAALPAHVKLGVGSVPASRTDPFVTAFTPGGPPRASAAKESENRGSKIAFLLKRGFLGVPLIIWAGLGCLLLWYMTRSPVADPGGFQLPESAVEAASQELMSEELLEMAERVEDEAGSEADGEEEEDGAAPVAEEDESDAAGGEEEEAAAGEAAAAEQAPESSPSPVPVLKQYGAPIPRPNIQKDPKCSNSKKTLILVAGLQGSGTSAITLLLEKMGFFMATGNPECTTAGHVVAKIEEQEKKVADARARQEARERATQEREEAAAARTQERRQRAEAAQAARETREADRAAAADQRRQERLEREAERERQTEARAAERRAASEARQAQRAKEVADREAAAEQRKQERIAARAAKAGGDRRRRRNLLADARVTREESCMWKDVQEDHACSSMKLDYHLEFEQRSGNRTSREGTSYNPMLREMRNLLKETANNRTQARVIQRMLELGISPQNLAGVKPSVCYNFQEIGMRYPRIVEKVETGVKNAVSRMGSCHGEGHIAACPRGVGFKTYLNMFLIPYFANLPDLDVKVVHVVKDARDHTLTKLENQPVCREFCDALLAKPIDNSKRRSLTFWATINKQVTECAETMLGDAGYTYVRIEDFVDPDMARREVAIANLLGFLRVPREEVEMEELTHVFHTPIATKASFFQDHFGLWRDAKHDPDFIGSMEDIAREELVYYGYEVLYKSKEDKERALSEMEHEKVKKIKELTAQLSELTGTDLKKQVKAAPKPKEVDAELAALKGEGEGDAAAAGAKKAKAKAGAGDAAGGDHKKAAGAKAKAAGKAAKAPAKTRAQKE